MTRQIPVFKLVLDGEAARTPVGYLDRERYFFSRERTERVARKFATSTINSIEKICHLDILFEPLLRIVDPQRV